MRTTALLLLLCSASLLLAQDNPIQQGTWEFGIWAGGGPSVPGGTSGVGVFDAGLRAGKVLTGEHLPGVLCGNFEYAVEAIPLYLVHIRDTRYGAALNPVILKWNFSGRSIAPYVEFGGGVLLSSGDIPPGTSSVNFTPQAAAGLQFFRRESRAVVAAVKYVHISNAGLSTPNPGINTLQVTVGYSWFH